MNNTNDLILVRSALGFLVKEQGFLLRENPNRLYYIESSNCEVLVIFEMWKVYVSIGPIGNPKSKLLKSDVRAGRVDIKIISKCLNPKLVFPEVGWDAKIDIEEELAFYAKLLKQYCKKMITRDFSEWHIVQNCLKERREKSGGL